MGERITAERWQRVESLFDAALTLPVSERDGFLARESSDDPSVLREVQGLLANADPRADLFERPVADWMQAPAAATLPTGTRVGAYRVLHLVGSGGMGEVYRVERDDGQFQQQAALKLIRREAVQHLDCFHEERRMLARLDHPGIARLFDGGIADDGRPYMVMEWIDGLPITEWCRQHDAGLAQRLDIFQQVCDAVEYAHRNLLVHRDLKPGNVLVNGEGRVKLLDFGVAKLITPNADLAQLTVAPVTPAYAAPEQLAQGPITTATDVYALGLILFELLTGQRPFHRQGMSLAQLIDRQQHTAAPSLRGVEREATASPLPVRHLRGDLDAIVAKALRREPEHRYTTVAALLSDVQRHVRGEPVNARRGARGYVLSRFLLRYRWLVSAVALLIVSLVAGLAGTLWQARIAKAQAQRAEVQARRATAVQEFITDIFRANSANQPDPLKAQQTTARELLDHGAQQVDDSLADAPEARLSVLNLFGDLYDGLQLPDDAVKARRQAADLARTLHGTDSTAHAAALLELAESLMESKTGTDQSEDRREILEQAERVLDHLGDADATHRGKLWLLWATHAMYTDKPRAIDYAHRAVTALSEAGPSPDLVSSLIVAGREELSARDLKAAIASFSRGLEVTHALGADYQSHLPELHALLGDAQFRVGDIAQAETNSRLGMSLAMQYHGEKSVDAVMAGMKLGVLLFSTGRRTEALEVLRTARAHALEIGGDSPSYMTHFALLRYGYLRARAGALAEGLRDIEAAAAQLDAIAEPILRASTLERTAEDAFVPLGRYDAARRDLDQARRIRIESGQDASSASMLGNSCARIRLALAEGDAALALGLSQELPITDGSEVSLSSYEYALVRAEALLAAGQADEAAALAVRVRQRIGTANLGTYLDDELARADLVEGQAELRRGRPEAARTVLDQAVTRLKTVLLPSSPRIAEAQVALAQANLALRENPKARQLAREAATIQAAHPELGRQYRGPLRNLEAKL